MFVSYVSAHIADATVATACEACHLAPRTMQRLSHEEFSFGLKTLITEVRMMRAMELLAQDTMPIEAVAQSIGYSSVSAFTTAFSQSHRAVGGRVQAAQPRCLAVLPEPGGRRATAQDRKRQRLRKPIWIGHAEETAAATGRKY